MKRTIKKFLSRTLDDVRRTLIFLIGITVIGHQLIAHYNEQHAYQEANVKLYHNIIKSIAAFDTARWQLNQFAYYEKAHPNLTPEQKRRKEQYVSNRDQAGIKMRIYLTDAKYTFNSETAETINSYGSV